jgi:2-phospho-L-lactate transferase/gluconeogenesis factor (CofD/UPF0052 family)
MFKKLISAVVLFTFVISNVAFAIPDISSQNKAELQKQETIDLAANPEKVVVLRDHGLVKSKYVGRGGKLIVHIQDAHCNFEAQSNIVNILENLYKNYNVSFISVEGADGIIDTTWFKSFPDEEIRKEVATYFMKKGEITGPEFLAITSDYPIKLFGAETRSYYIQNLNAFTSSYPQKEEVENYLNSIKAVIEKLKNYIYSKDLKLMDSKMRDYESKKLEFKDYVKFLESEAAKIKLNIRSYENFFKLVSTLIYEKKIDFNVTDKERSTLIDELSRKMSKDSLTELVSQSLAFKVGKISSVEYYSYLRALAMKNGVDLMKTYPNLFNYMIYNAVYSKIENEKLFTDIKNIENAIKEKLFTSDDQRALEKLSRHIEILLGLVNIKLLNGDFDYYKANKDEFSYETFISFLSKQAARYGLSYTAEPPSEVIAENMPRLEDFYAIAIKRDKALVDNTLNEMNKEKQKVGVLVTGGFHSEGIAKLLESAGVSYLVVCPNITKDVETPYIKILTNQRTPLEDILSDTAQTTQTKQGMLAPILMSKFAGLSPERISAILSEVEGVDKAALDALIRDIITRERRLEDGWEAFGISSWLMKKLKIANAKKYAHNETTMLKAYKSDAEAMLVNAGLERKRASELAAAITANAEFHNGFSVLYKRISARTAVSGIPVDGEKKYPAAKDEATQSQTRKAYISRLRRDLEDIFGNDSQRFNDYIEKARIARNLATAEEVIAGMLNFTDPSDAKARLEKAMGQINATAPPKDATTILTFGGGTGLLASIKPIMGLGAYVNSIQSSVDDGGSTFKMVMALIAIGHGWMPSPGDIANSLVQGMGSADKLYKLLDNQGRISVVNDGQIKKAKDPDHKDVKNGKALPNVDKEGNAIAKGKIVFYDEDRRVVYLDSFYELCKRLLARIVKQTVITQEGIGYTEKTVKLGDDFAYFAAGMLNMAKRMDDKFFSGAAPIIPMDGASIRNLVLLAAMDYIGLVDFDNPRFKKGSREFMLSNSKLVKKFQTGLDLMASFANAHNGKVSISHTDPVTIYCIHRDNVIIIEEKPGVRSPDGKKWDVEPVLHVLAVNAGKAQIAVRVPELNNKSITLNGANLQEIVKIGNLDITLKMDDREKFAFSVNGSPFATLIEPEKIEDTYVDYDGKEHRIATDGTGMVRSPAEAGKVKYGPIEMAGKKAYVRSRLTAMQTHITETPNYSKVVDIGFVAPVNPEKDIENVEGEKAPRYIYRPDSKKRSKANKDVLGAINSPNTKGVVFGPGSFLTSLMPHFLVNGIGKALAERRKKGDIPIVLIINPNIDNETAEFSIGDILAMIEKKTGYPIDELFTDIIVNKFDTIKMDEELGAAASPMSARWYVNRVLANPGLIDELGLFYFKHLINEYVNFAGIPLHALSDSYSQRFSMPNDDGKIIKVGDETEITLAEYLEFKINEFLKALYQEPKPEIRTDPGDPSNEAKKSRGPTSYTMQEIYAIKKNNPRIKIYRDMFLAGVEFAAPRDPSKPAESHIGFMEDYTSLLFGDVLNMKTLNNEIVQAYKKLYQGLPKDVKNNPLDNGALSYIYYNYRAHLIQLIDQNAKKYFEQLSFTSFRRLIDSVNIRENMEKNERKGFGITIVAGLPFGTAEFANKVEALRQRIKNITNGRVEFNEERGVGALHMTIQAVTRTKNFEEGDPASMGNALVQVKDTVTGINTSSPAAKGDVAGEIANIASSSKPFSVRITGFNYYAKDGELSFNLEPINGYTAVGGKKELDIRKDLSSLNMESKGEGLHISLGRITRPLDSRQIDAIDRLFNELEMDRLEPFELDNVKVVMYGHRSLSDIVALEQLNLGKDNSLNFGRLYSEAENMAAATSKRSVEIARERRDAYAVARKLHTPLDAKGDKAMADGFKKDGFGSMGYGDPEGAVIDGSFATGDEGNQGYYVEGGKEIFLGTVASMMEFFNAREKALGKQIKYVIKPGIGGQHATFQAIASGFGVIDATNGVAVGEYELGKDYEAEMADVLARLGADWDQIAVIPSSKSGSTDETMMIFTEILYVLLKNIATKEGVTNGELFAGTVLKSMHEVNFIYGKERDGKDLFKGFSLERIRGDLASEGLKVGIDKIKEIFGVVLGNMFFETVDNPEKSRLAAFIRNSGLDKALGENAPGFGRMFDNVGGRWTGDLHMMTFLAYYGLNAEEYWNIRYKGIKEVREGTGAGNVLANKILDEGITDIALVVPDELFWLGKALEQNFNESIWQNGFANLIAVPESQWKNQKAYYANGAQKLVINLTGLAVSAQAFNVFNLERPNIKNVAGLSKQDFADSMAEIFSIFYGMTHTVGNTLIERALAEKGYKVSDVDINNLNNSATKVVQQNLYLRQPFVELGKEFLEKRLNALQKEERATPGAIDKALGEIKALAVQRKIETNIKELNLPEIISNERELARAVGSAMSYAKQSGRKLVPFIYLEGSKFQYLRDHLVSLGVEWVLQGTGDQHINLQQVLSQPQKYLPFIISFIPQKTQSDRPAIGFGKGYLNKVSPNLVRDYFAEASYKALTERRAKEGGKGIFLRMTDSEPEIGMLKAAFEKPLVTPPTEKKSANTKRVKDGEKNYPAKDAEGMTAEQIYQVSTIPERDSLQQYLASSALSSALDKRAIIIAHDTAIAPGQVAQAGERPINKYLGGKLIDVRATGKKLLDGIAEAAQELEAAGIPYKVVTIAGNSTMDEVGRDLTSIGKVLNIQNPDNRYVSIIGLYEVALRIAYDSSSEEILLCLNRVAINPDNRPFTKDDVDTLLTKGILMILPKIVPVNPSENAAAYKAAQQALVSL